MTTHERSPGRRRRTGPPKAVLWSVAGVMLLTGCSFDGLQDIPLPGGAAADGNAYRVTVEFRDVLDLVPQSAVKVNNVTVGAVEKIELDGWQAKVELRISDSVKLPANAVAELEQTSMLGEKYVSLAAPAEIEPVGKLTDGTQIPLSRSSRNQEIEEVLSALSALLNGGGVAQLHTITKELNNALEGRESRVKSLLTELDTFIGGLDEQKTEIVRAMEGLDRLSKTLKKEKGTITEAVDTIPPGLKVLAGQRENLTKMLTSLSELGVVGTKVIRASHDDVIANLKNLQPILSRLNEAGDDLPNALEILTTYPFPRSATDAIKGDFVNLKVTADMDLRSIYGNLTDPGDRKRGEPKPDGPVPELPGVPKPELPDLPGTGDSKPLPCLPGGECDEEGSGGSESGPQGSEDDNPLCPPVCTSSQASYSSTGTPLRGVNMDLAELMTRGLIA